VGRLSSVKDWKKASLVSKEWNGAAVLSGMPNAAVTSAKKFEEMLKFAEEHKNFITNLTLEGDWVNGEKLAKLPPSLTSVELKGAKFGSITPEEAKAFFEKQPNLKELKVGEMRATEPLNALIGKAPASIVNLTINQIAGGKYPTPLHLKNETLDHLETLPQLKRLEIINLSKYSGSSENIDDLIAHLPTQISSLHLPGLPPEKLASVKQRCPNAEITT
jgi:hypothetical protein